MRMARNLSFLLLVMLVVSSTAIRSQEPDCYRMESEWYCGGNVPDCEWFIEQCCGEDWPLAWCEDPGGCGLIIAGQSCCNAVNVFCEPIPG